MKERVLILIALLFIYYISNSQNHIDENYDCELLNWKFKYIDNPTSVDTTLIFVKCLIIRNQYEKGMSLLDSLIEKNKDNPELYLQKAYHQADKKELDTAYFVNFRIALKHGAEPSLTLYNLGVHYFNYVVACNDSSSPVTLSASEKINLIKQAESFVKQSAVHNKEYLSYSYEFLSLSKEFKAKIRNEDLPPLALTEEFDTLLIMSRLPDCGEFGGHIEYIKCYYQQGELKAVFWKDDPICDIVIPKEVVIENDYKTDPQTVSKEALFQYLYHVINIDKSPSVYTNAPTSFWIVKDNDPFFIRDWTGNSKEYELFRDKIFSK